MKVSSGNQSPFVPLLVVIACSLAEAGEPLAPGDLPTDFRFGTAAVEGMTLAWTERPGTGPALVLIPGTFNDCRIYSQVVPRLDPVRRTIIMEHAGHGKSWPPDGDASVERCAAHVMGMLDRLKIESCFLGGHSLGGMVAMEAARRSPERFRGIILIEGWTNSRSAEAAFLGDMTSTLRPDVRGRIDAHRHQNASRWPLARQQSFLQLWKQWDGSGFLRETDLPVLQLYGDRGRPRPAAEVLGIPERPQIRLQWISGASHWLHAEKPTEVAASIEEFINAVERQGR